MRDLSIEFSSDEITIAPGGSFTWNVVPIDAQCRITRLATRGGAGITVTIVSGLRSYVEGLPCTGIEITGATPWGNMPDLDWPIVPDKQNNTLIFDNPTDARVSFSVSMRVAALPSSLTVD